MEKKSFKNRQSVKQNESLQQDFEILDEKYQKMKDIFKQVLKDFRCESEKREVLETECKKLLAEVKEKDFLLERMQSVSEAVVDEFSALKVKCEMETKAANNAIKRATKYFQENQKLKGNSQNDLSLITNGIDSDFPSENTSWENVSELEYLNNLNSDLRTEVADLKTQLNKEIEKQSFLKQDFDIAKKLYEQEVSEHKCTSKKLQSLELEYESVANADNLKNSRNISIENISTVQNSEDNVKDPRELLAALENQKNSLRNRVKELENQILNIRLNGSFDEPLCIPPPPPLPPPSFKIKSLFTFINGAKKSGRRGTDSVNKGLENGNQKAMSEMINAIKKGNIQLKPVPKANTEKKSSSEPVALVEMRNILETLKKRECFSKAKTVETTNEELKNYQNESATSTEIKLDSPIIGSRGKLPCSFDSIQENGECLNYEDVLKRYSSDGDLSTNGVISPCVQDCNEDQFLFGPNSSCDIYKVEEDDKIEYLI